MREHSPGKKKNPNKTKQKNPNPNPQKSTYFEKWDENHP